MKVDILDISMGAKFCVKINSDNLLKPDVKIFIDFINHNKCACCEFYQLPNVKEWKLSRAGDWGVVLIMATWRQSNAYIILGRPPLLFTSWQTLHSSAFHFRNIASSEIPWRFSSVSWPAWPQPTDVCGDWGYCSPWDLPIEPPCPLPLPPSPWSHSSYNTRFEFCLPIRYFGVPHIFKWTCIQNSCSRNFWVRELLVWLPWLLLPSYALVTAIVAGTVTYTNSRFREFCKQNEINSLNMWHLIMGRCRYFVFVSSRRIRRLRHDRFFLRRHHGPGLRLKNEDRRWQ